MDEIDMAIEYGRKKKFNRVRGNKMRRLRGRVKNFGRTSRSNTIDVDIPVSDKLESLDLNSAVGNGLVELSLGSQLSENASFRISFGEDDNVNEDSSSDLSDGDDFLLHSPKFGDRLMKLHHHTPTDKLTFCMDLMTFIRKANINKTHAEELIRLFHNNLPQPNNLPKNYSGLLDYLSVEELYSKRTLCIKCGQDLPKSARTCLVCGEMKSKYLASVFDVCQEAIFARTYDRLSTVVHDCRNTFSQHSLNNENNDIVYNRNYKQLCDSIDYPFISLILHIDGIGLSKSSNQSMWLLTCSIVELPPTVRNQRRNNLILSMWIGKQQPKMDLWLNESLKQLKHIKSTGMRWSFN